MADYLNLIENLTPVAREAGQAIMDIYHKSSGHTLKEDGSPVTLADKAAERIILSVLKAMKTGIMIISEENPASHELDAPETFFLVDPLDGTKEFLKKDGKGAFTVNIALIENGAPTLGIIYAPALDRMFYGAKNIGAFENSKQIQVRDKPDTGLIAVASQSHRDEETNKWLTENQIAETISIGSSVKFCLLACGEADVYPRFSPTMEWDTAAGDAILRAAGGIVLNPDGSLFQYGKNGYKNGHFIAKGLLQR